MVELGNIHSPADIKQLNKKELTALCAQLRQTMIDTVSANGGHLASNLGVVELTVWDWNYDADRAVFTDTKGQKSDFKLLEEGKRQRKAE